MAVSAPAWPVVARVQSHEAPWFLDVSAPWAVVVPVVFSSWLYFCAPCAFGFFIVPCYGHLSSSSRLRL